MTPKFKYLQWIRSKCSGFLYGRPVHNYFKTRFKKNAIISYIAYPFHVGPSQAHTNGVEALSMAEVLRDLCYNVDVYNYDHEGPGDYSKYSLIIGFGEPLINSFYKRTHVLRTIYYGTGMHIAHQNDATLRRVKEVYCKRNVWIPESGRIVDKAWSVQTSLVDAIITLGNQTVINSYKKYFDGPVYNVPVTYSHLIDPVAFEGSLDVRDFSAAKSSFIWFGGSGLIHKGLDLLLEVFKDLPGYTLHVCGPLKSESRFTRLYTKELSGTLNIKSHGFVEIGSVLFNRLVAESAFCILPSCAEGEPSSVVNLMAAGVIPVVPDTAGIRLKGFGFQIDALSYASIRLAVKTAASQPEPVLRNMAKRMLIDTRDTHSIDAYKSAMRDSIVKACGA